MDDHNNPHHQTFMSCTDLRRLINGRPAHFQPIPQPPDLFPAHRSALQHYGLMHQMVGRPLGELVPSAALHEFPPDSVSVPPPAAAAVATASTPRAAAAFDCESSGFGGDNGTGRWPRQETLTLLEIRSRLDSKFKEANQKGPLWDEVSRIMCEEHGFQRSGKKCREKFENLYKYYKKTKEGKAGRQDGKHYRFFRQLEALYGETTAPASVQEAYTPVADEKDNFPAFYNANSSNPNSLSISAEANSSELESSSSDDSMLEKERKRRGSSSSGKSYWKAKIKGFIDEQMRKLMDRQEAWLEKLTSTMEKKEEERRLREEEWRQQEAARMDRERRFWARERAWIEARDAALVEALQNLTGKVVLPARASLADDQAEGLEEEEARNNGDHNLNGDHETSNCNQKEGGKKRKGNSRSTSSHCNYGGAQEIIERMQGSEGVSPTNDSCFPFLMADGDQNFWENYGLKMNKGEN